MVFIFIYPYPPGLIQKHESIHGLCEVRYSILCYIAIITLTSYHTTLYTLPQGFSHGVKDQIY